MAYKLTYTGEEIQDLLDKVDTIPYDIASTTTYFGTLLSSGWVGSSAPYSQTITVTGMLSTDEPIVDVTFSGVYLDDINIASAWSKIYDLDTGTNQATFYADKIPSVDVTVRMKVVR